MAAAPIRTPLMRPMRVAVCGEVRSGKSTVLNAVLKAPVLPDLLAQAERPVIFLRHRNRPGVDLVHGDGRVVEAARLDDPEALRGVVQIVLWSEAPHLEGVEVVEVPLTCAEDLTAPQISLLRSADAMIWVTIAAQAWRLTEKTILDRLSQARPARRLLAVSRADKLRRRADQDKLEDRLRRETAGYFEEVVFVHGARRHLTQAAQAPAKWAKTGGAAVMDWVAGCAEDSRAARQAEAADGADDADGDTDATNTPDAVAAAQAGPETAHANPAKPAVQTPVQTPAPAVPRATRDRAGETASHSAFRAVARSGVAAAGIVPPAAAASGDCEVLAGDRALCQALAQVCRTTMAGLGGAFGAGGEAGPVAGCTLSMGQHRLVMVVLPGAGLGFVLGDPGTLGLGAAQALIARVDRARIQAA